MLGVLLGAGHFCYFRLRQAMIIAVLVAARYVLGKTAVVCITFYIFFATSRWRPRRFGRCHRDAEVLHVMHWIVINPQSSYRAVTLKPMHINMRFSSIKSVESLFQHHPQYSIVVYTRLVRSIQSGNIRDSPTLACLHEGVRRS